MPLDAEVHLGDVGTLYRLRITDDNVPLDPTSASVKQIIFRLPTGESLTKTADAVVQVGSDWYLTYQIKPNDGIGGNTDFHASIGSLKVQAYLEWASGSKFHSTVATIDQDGRSLKVYANLS